MTHKQLDHLAMYIDQNRVVMRPEVQKLLGGISRSTLGRRVKSGEFPSPKLTIKRHSCWIFKDIHKWLPN